MGVDGCICFSAPHSHIENIEFHIGIVAKLCGFLCGSDVLMW